MVTKAIIENVIDSSHITVRIPVLDRIENSSTGTPLDSCQIASVCSLPNIEYNFNIGDIVFVDFEDNNMDSPVILGYLYGVNDSKIDGNILSLSVDSCAKLSDNVSIGNVSKEDIECLYGINTNIQNSINLLKNNNFNAVVHKNNVYISSEEDSKKDVDNYVSSLNETQSSIDEQTSFLLEEWNRVEENLVTVIEKVGEVDGSISDMLDDLEEKVSQLEETYSNGYFV